MAHNNEKQTSSSSEKEMLERIEQLVSSKQGKGQPAKSGTKEYALLVGLAILVVVSAVQTMKLSSIQAKGNSGTGGASVQSSSAGSGGGAPLPSTLQNIPTQVGGC